MCGRQQVVRCLEGGMQRLSRVQSCNCGGDWQVHGGKWIGFGISESRSVRPKRTEWSTCNMTMEVVGLALIGQALVYSWKTPPIIFVISLKCRLNQDMHTGRTWQKNLKWSIMKHKRRCKNKVASIQKTALLHNNTCLQAFLRREKKKRWCLSSNYYSHSHYLLIKCKTLIVIPL